MASKIDFNIYIKKYFLGFFTLISYQAFIEEIFRFVTVENCKEKERLLGAFLIF
jgi:hypothetical protein